MKIKRFLFLFTFVAMIISCDKKEDNDLPKVDAYPTSVGTEWTYDRQVIIKKYESEVSDEIIDIDTLVFTVKVWIERDTVLNDTINVKVFKSRENDYSWTSDQYKYLDNKGLRNYAYSNAGGANVFAKKNSSLQSAIDFNNYMSLKNGILSSDEIIFEDKPTLEIKFPLDLTSSWTYILPSETRLLQIDKEVIGTESLTLFGQTFSCFKVSWNYLNDPVYEGISLTEWISEKGLIKRLTIHDRVTFTNANGEPQFYGQFIETLTLKGLKIK